MLATAQIEESTRTRIKGHTRTLCIAALLPIAIASQATGATATDTTSTPPNTFLKASATDWDLDRLSNTDERKRGTDPRHADTDRDGIADGHEVNGIRIAKPLEEHSTQDPRTQPRITTNPLLADSDGDRVNDADENRNQTDPNVSDTDSDGLSDGQEIHDFLGMNGENRTNPLYKDTDHDGTTDGAEVDAGTDPNSYPPELPTRDYTDNDGDDLGDYAEWGYYQTDFTTHDTDKDGAPDSVEVYGQGNATWAIYPDSATNALQKDSDGDGLNDGDEFAYGTNANAADSDGDGLGDHAEGFFSVHWHGKKTVVLVDPLNKDQDGNGSNDSHHISPITAPRP